MVEKGENQPQRTSGDAAVTEQAAPPQRTCANHGDRPAVWFCDRCGEGFCEDCVRVRDFTTFQAYFCRRCGDQCRPPVQPVPNPTKSFLEELTRVPAYPFRGKGPYILVGGTIFFTIISWLLGTRIIILHPGTGMIFGILQGILGVLFLGYFFAYAFDVAASTAGGEDEPPDWPDFGDPTEFLRPLGLVIAVVAMCFFPAVAYVIAVLSDVATGSEALLWLLIAVGVLFLPMALLSAVLYGSLAGLNPVHLFKSITRIGPAYLAGIVALAVVVMLGDLLLIRNVLGIPVLGTLVAVAVELYCVIAAMRVIGLIYACYEDRLRWFAAD